VENFKQKNQSTFKHIAFNLIQLYTPKKTWKGSAPDSYLQNELESSFIYEDTDQTKSTAEVKADMESDDQWIAWFVVT
jgi:transcription-repair coupling factor (superfamily II helicase)